MSVEWWVGALWPLTLVLTFGLAFSWGLALRRRPAAPEVFVEAPTEAREPEPIEQPAPVPEDDLTPGLLFLRGCTDRLVGAVVSQLRSTIDPMTSGLLAVHESMAVISREVRRHEEWIRSGQDLERIERIEALGLQARSAMEGVSQATQSSAQSFERHFQVLKASQSNILETSAKIEDLAERINVLAINASIEAARAGSAGRGFKVIAGEVKALALESAAFLKAIKDAVGHTAALYDTIQVDLGSQKHTVAGYLERQARSFTEFQTEFSGQRADFQAMVDAVSKFVDGLGSQMSGLSPVVQVHEIAVQELENLALVVSDGLTALARTAKAEDAPLRPDEAAAWAARVRLRLTTTAELKNLEAFLSGLGMKTSGLHPSASAIELF